MPEISLSTGEFKALSSESRTRILKLLEERNHTLSELAAKTGMAAPTIKQHAGILVQTGLIELRDEGRKWKYYALTRKGTELMHANKSHHTSVFIILSLATLVGLFGIAMLFMNLGSMSAPQIASQTGTGAPMDYEKAFGAREAESETMITAGQVTKTGACTPTGTLSQAAENLNDTNTAQDYLQECSSAQSQEECFAVDIFDEENSVLGSEDGKPDCEWKAG